MRTLFEGETYIPVDTFSSKKIVGQQENYPIYNVYKYADLIRSATLLSMFS